MFLDDDSVFAISFSFVFVAKIARECVMISPNFNMYFSVSFPVRQSRRGGCFVYRFCNSFLLFNLNPFVCFACYHRLAVDM